MTARDELRRELFQDFGGTTLPDPVPLDLEILWKRTFLDYEEWKIEYDVESPETMPLKVGQRVPAYLLVPRHQSEPMPAMIAFHQCAGDCTNAKEAVVGKAPWIPIDSQTSYFQTDGRVHIDRTDQAYARLKVHFGMVPDPEPLSLKELAIEARKATKVSWDDLDVTFNDIGGPDVPVTSIREQVLSAIGGLFMFMADRSLSGTIDARVGLEGDRPFLSCKHTASEDLSSTPTPSDYSSMRGVGKALVELGATLQYEHSGKRIAYRILFPAAM